MSKKGIYFTVKKNSKNSLNKIFYNIQTSYFKYYVNSFDVVNSKSLNQLEEEFYNEKVNYLKLLFNMNFNYMLLDVNLFLFNENPVNIKNNIEYYENNNCKMCFRVSDLYYYTIFIKDKIILEQIYNNIKNDDTFYDINFFDENDNIRVN